MLYAVLGTGRPGETGVRDRFFQAPKQAQSFRLGSWILRAAIQSLCETASSNSDWRLWRRRHRIDVDRPLAVCRPISRVAPAHQSGGGEYQPAMEEVRSGRIPFSRLDVLHRRMLNRILPPSKSRMCPRMSCKIGTWHGTVSTLDLTFPMASHS
jgi:hypothetical protein